MEDNLFFVDTKGNAKNFNKTEVKKRKIEEDNEEEKTTKKGLTSRVVIGEDRDSSDEEAPSAAELQLAAKLFGDTTLLSEQFGHELESRQNNEIESEDEEDKTTERAPAWFDADDDLTTKTKSRGGFTGRRWEKSTTTSSDLRSQFLKVHGEASWATLPTEEQEDEAAIYRSTMPLLAKTTKRLPVGILEYNRMSDANHEDVSKSDITTRFHPKTSLLLVGGQDNKLKLFQVDGVKNSKVAGVAFGDMPIRVAEFTSDGEDIIVTGRRKYYYTYNLGSAKVEKIQYIVGEEEERSLERFFVSPDNKYITILGKNGNIMMLSRQSKQLLYSLRMNDGASTAAFTADGLNMYTSGTGGTIYKWDLRTRRCVNKFVNEGSIRNTSLAISPDGSYLATGDESGVINIYETAGLGEKKPMPFKSVTSLTTSVNHLKFNAQSQILGASSTGLPNSFKMVHVPSFTTFSNWPPQNKFPVVSTFDYSPNSGFVAVATNKGSVQVYKLNHYPLP